MTPVTASNQFKFRQDQGPDKTYIREEKKWNIMGLKKIKTSTLMEYEWGHTHSIPVQKWTINGVTQTDEKYINGKSS